MKKVLVMMLALTFTFAISGYVRGADETVKAKEKTTTVNGVTTTKVNLKDTTTGATAKEKVVTTDTSTTTKQEVKAKNIKMKTEEVVSPSGKAGIAMVDVKKGAIKEMNIEWNYRQAGTEYITEYTIKDKNNKVLMKELNLTPTQTAMLTTGTHRIVSTSPYTGSDIRDNIRAIILKDIQTATKKK